MNGKSVKIFWFVALFVLGSAGLLFILPSLTLRILFAALMVGVIFWTLKSGPAVEINTLSLVSAYVLSIAQYSINFYFPKSLQGWLIMILTFSWVTVLFWLGFNLKMGSIKLSARILTLTLGLVAGELAMALLFLPIHFLIIGTVFFLLFYLAWMTANFYMGSLLNWHRVAVHVAFVGVLLLVILSTANWAI